MASPSFNVILRETKRLASSTSTHKCYILPRPYQVRVTSCHTRNSSQTTAKVLAASSSPKLFQQSLHRPSMRIPIPFHHRADRPPLVMIREKVPIYLNPKRGVRKSRRRSGIAQCYATLLQHKYSYVIFGLSPAGARRRIESTAGGLAGCLFHGVYVMWEKNLP